MKPMKKGKKNIIACLIVVGVLGLLSVGLYLYYGLCMDPYRGTVDQFNVSLSMDSVLTKEQAEEDLEFLVKQIRERHSAWLLHDERIDRMEAQYRTEKEQLQDEVTVLELLRASSRIAAILEDGHTWVSIEETNPLFISSFMDVIEYGTPIQIDGIDIEQLFDLFKNYYSSEREEYSRKIFENSAILCEKWLKILGIDTADGVTFLFHTPEGEVESSYSFVTMDQVEGIENTQMETPWVSYTIDEEKHVGIFTLMSCDNNDEYKGTLDAFFREVNEKGIENVVVDLRQNGGGDSSVADEFIHYLDVDQYSCWDFETRYGWYLWKEHNNVIQNEKKDIVFSGQVFVITDIFSYSSAMDFAQLIQDNHIGTLVGEASGNMPDGYGDCLYFQLPNSQLSMGVSYKHWHRLDESKSGEPLTPDYVVKPSEALDKIYELIQE